MNNVAETSATLPQEQSARAAGSLFILKRLIPVFMLLAGAGAMILSYALDFIGLGGMPGFGARQLTIALSGLSVFFAGLVLLLPEGRRWVGDWLLIGSTIPAVALASDFIVLNTGLPGAMATRGMMAAVAASLLATRIYPAFVTGLPGATGWRSLLAVDWRAVWRFAFITAQLFLLVLLIGEYSLENEVFSHNFMLLTLYGFSLHFLLPPQYRLPFFVLLSLTGIAGVLGLANGAWLFGIGLLLVGIAHLPIRFVFRVALLLATGALLALARMAWISVPWSAAIWPILGSMFMFRMIVYLYDLKHQKEPFTLSRTLAYFFLLPNVVFPLFPVVDFSAFRRTYFNEDQFKIYQVGITWILRGAFHLVLYRLVSYHILIAPEDVTNIFDLVRYLVANISLYLRVSGQFHIIIGILHLFDFNLPETNHLYFLACSFTDYWRRINIYWKDFMLKVFYYPFYFQLRRFGANTRLVFATLLVFFVTWLLHAVQWFWLRGSFLLTPQDVLFWTILAGLVIANSLYESKRGRQRRLTKRAWTVRTFGSQALRTAGTFAVIAVLWSLWTSTSLSEWFALWAVPLPSLGEAARSMPTLLVFAFVGGSVGLGWSKVANTRLGMPAFLKSSTATGLAIVCLYLFGNPLVYTRFEAPASTFIHELRTAKLNRQDEALLERGYYEDLIGVNRFNSQLWEIYMKRPQERLDIFRTEAGRMTDDFMIGELKPSASILFFDLPFSTNRWGMRDQDYEMAKAPGAYRVALIGASIPMGWGVGDGETFEALVEERLNAENDGSRYTGYEMLNFSVEGYNTTQNLVVFENKALDFQPDALFFVAHPKDEDRVITDLVGRVRSGVEIPFDYLSELVAREGVTVETPETLAKRKLKPYSEEIMFWAYRRMVADCEQREILPVLVLLPRIVGVDEPELAESQRHMAEKAGFILLDLTDVYVGQDIDALLLASWDWHPNAAGHRLIARRLWQGLEENRDRIPLGMP